MLGEPNLYGQYDRDEAITLFGPEGGSRNFCDGQWVIFPRVVLCFAELGERPRGSHFRNGGGFCWVADKPYRVSDNKHVKFVPREVVGGHGEALAIHLFVRKRGSGRYLYVGKLGPAHRFSHRGREHHGEAYFVLSPTLPSEVWARIGGFDPGNLDHHAVDNALNRLREPIRDAVDNALNRLREPIRVGERLEVLRQVVAYWHGPIRPEDGFSGQELEGLAIPHPLRWWYGWAGRRRTIMSGQNGLLAPDKLRMSDGLLEFYLENQYCYQWGSPIEGDDPPVSGRAETNDPWVSEGITLSEHLILACLFEAIVCHSPYGASTAWLDKVTLNRIVEHVPPVAINPWRWAGSTRFYAKGGAFMYAMGEYEIDGKQGSSVAIGAKTEHPLQFLKPYIDKDWVFVAV